MPDVVQQEHLRVILGPKFDNVEAGGTLGEFVAIEARVNAN